MQHSVSRGAATGRAAARTVVPVPHVAPTVVPCVQKVAQQGRSVAPAAQSAPRVNVTASRSPVICKAASVETPSLVREEGVVYNELLRNIAIIAHVDHGKTTLVDTMLKQSKVFRDNQVQTERVMDSNDLERERGITILAKNTAITYKGTKINIIDTPGHADFGGEVERVLNMCDGVLLLVDSVEGAMPQTRFVLTKALALEKKVIVVVNKIDRDSARPDWVVDNVFELFMDLGATDEQCEFDIVYASGFKGVAGYTADTITDNLEPLFDTIVAKISPPRSDETAPLQMMVANIDYDPFLGRIGVGRVLNGSISKGQTVSVCSSLTPDKFRTGKISELYVYDNFSRTNVDQVMAGDICAVAGMPEITIGETICQREVPNPLPTIKVEDPTVSMTFKVNTSPFAGKEGKFVTSRNIKERLDRELERNLALQVEAGVTGDQFVVRGRGMLHLGILIENMRREGYEFEIGSPQVVQMEINGKKCEPFEEALVDVPESSVGAVVELFAQRKGEMTDMVPSVTGTTRLSFRIATRGLIGLRNQLLTATKGMGVVNTNFLEYAPFLGEINVRDNGSLVAFETGMVTAYSLETAQMRGIMFQKPQDQVYAGQVIGIHAKAGDLKINICKAKALTNMRAAGKDKTTGLDEPKSMGLDDCLEYIGDDEQVEVTPLSIRIRKDPNAIVKKKK
eukprot:gene21330-28262_t